MTTLPRRSTKTLLALPLWLLAIVAAGWAVGAFNGGVGVDPLQSVACDSCHLAGDKAKRQNAKLLTAPPEQLCTSCHPGAVEASHPSGIAPSMKVPAQFPLDWKGHVTCSTCHNIHQPGHGRLRVDERGAAFCTACHDPSFFNTMADQGGSLLISGHMTSGTALEEAQSDEYSVQCMACHEERGEVMLGGNIARHVIGAMEHPIAVDYQQAFEFGGYRRASDLPEWIALPGGQVSCISCHEGYSSEHGKMVTSNEGSKLCFQCHEL